MHSYNSLRIVSCNLQYESTDLQFLTIQTYKDLAKRELHFRNFKVSQMKREDTAAHSGAKISEHTAMFTQNPNIKIIPPGNLVKIF